MLLSQSLPNNKILDQSKFKSLAYDIMNVTKELKFVLGMVENILGKGVKVGYQHFLRFPTVFSALSMRNVIILAT